MEIKTADSQQNPTVRPPSCLPTPLQPGVQLCRLVDGQNGRRDLGEIRGCPPGWQGQGLSTGY